MKFFFTMTITLMVLLNNNVFDCAQDKGQLSEKKSIWQQLQSIITKLKSILSPNHNNIIKELNRLQEQLQESDRLIANLMTAMWPDKGFTLVSESQEVKDSAKMGDSETGVPSATESESTMKTRSDVLIKAALIISELKKCNCQYEEIKEPMKELMAVTYNSDRYSLKRGSSIDRMQVHQKAEKDVLKTASGEIQKVRGELKTIKLYNDDYRAMISQLNSVARTAQSGGIPVATFVQDQSDESILREARTTVPWITGQIETIISSSDPEIKKSYMADYRAMISQLNSVARAAKNGDTPVAAFVQSQSDESILEEARMTIPWILEKIDKIGSADPEIKRVLFGDDNFTFKKRDADSIVDDKDVLESAVEALNDLERHLSIINGLRERLGVPQPAETCNKACSDTCNDTCKKTCNNANLETTGAGKDKATLEILMESMSVIKDLMQNLDAALTAVQNKWIPYKKRMDLDKFGAGYTFGSPQ